MHRFLCFQQGTKNTHIHTYESAPPMLCPPPPTFLSAPPQSCSPPPLHFFQYCYTPDHKKESILSVKMCSLTKRGVTGSTIWDLRMNLIRSNNLVLARLLWYIWNMVLRTTHIMYEDNSRTWRFTHTLNILLALSLNNVSSGLSIGGCLVNLLSNWLTSSSFAW